MSVTPASDWNNDEDVFRYDTIMNARKVPRTSAAATEAPSASVASKKKPEYRICGLPSRREEYEQLGPPQQKADCAGCEYLSDKEMAALPYEEFQELADLIRRKIAKTTSINLARFIEAKYEKIRQDINNDLDPGEEPLLEWKAATILDHLQGLHIEDPELYDHFNIKRLKELARIAENASVIVNIDTGEEKIDPVQAKEHREYVKQIEALSKSDVTVKRGYSGGAQIDVRTASEGPLAMTGRKMFKKWKQC